MMEKKKILETGSPEKKSAYLSGLPYKGLGSRWFPRLGLSMSSEIGWFKVTILGNQLTNQALAFTADKICQQQLSFHAKSAGVVQK